MMRADWTTDRLGRWGSVLLSILSVRLPPADLPDDIATWCDDKQTMDALAIPVRGRSAQLYGAVQT